MCELSWSSAPRLPSIPGTLYNHPMTYDLAPRPTSPTAPPFDVAADGYSPTFQDQSGQRTWNVGEYPSAGLLTTIRFVQQAERRLRFQRHDTARQIMYGYPAFRCMRRTMQESGTVSIRLEGDVAHWSGYGHCRNRGCPFCALTLAQEDRCKAEMYAAGWVKRGSSIAMVALTMAHTVDEDLSATWGAHTKVLESLHKGRPWRAFKDKYRIGEHFYGNELTDGKNGWHKHQHRCYELMPQPLLTTKEGRRLLAEQMQEDLWELYQVALRKHGRSASQAHGLKVTVAAGSDTSALSAADYVTKLSAETMCGGMKSGKNGNQTPWELLDDVTDKRLTLKQRQRASARYFAFATQARYRHWTYFSEAHVVEGAGAPEEIEVLQEAAVEPASDVQELVVHDLERRMIEHKRLETYLLDMAEDKGLPACAAFIEKFCSPQNWSKQFIRGGPTGPNGPTMPPRPRPAAPVTGESKYPRTNAPDLPRFGEQPAQPPPKPLPGAVPWPYPTMESSYPWYDPQLR